VAFSGERYRIAPSQVGPKPAGRIPVLLAGTRRRALTRVARRADGWLMTGAPPSAVEALLGQVRGLAADAGRDPKEIGCYFQMAVSGFAERTLYGGTVADLTDDLAALAAAGADHVFIQLPTVTSGLAEYLDRAAELHTAARRRGLVEA
jgi:alkanesulfonate monooxygenase SsuD/methylene tetrahydromethanopterin reductase-like flavin-dependent oxidoreductase (luciferase family)